MQSVFLNVCKEGNFPRYLHVILFVSNFMSHAMSFRTNNVCWFSCFCRRASLIGVSRVVKATQRCIMMTKSRDPYLCSFISLFRVCIGRARTILTAIAINYRYKGITCHPLLVL